MINTKGKTLQEVSDEIAKKLIEQGSPCSEGGICCYGLGETHCAIGWLLPEDSEAMKAEGNIFRLLEEYSVLGPNEQFLRENLGALSLLEVIHDIEFRGGLDTYNRQERIMKRDHNVDIEAWKPWFEADNKGNLTS